MTGLLKFEEYKNQNTDNEVEIGPEVEQTEPTEEQPVEPTEQPVEPTEAETNSTEEPKYGCLMVNFAFTNWPDFIRRQIKPEDIYIEEENDDFGYEDEAHCTILFGFNHYDNIVEDIKQHLLPLEEITDILRGDITTFEQDNYDVVKFDLFSDKLAEMNKKLKENFETHNDYPDYKPHMTIAYVKKGKGINYTKDNLQKIPLFPSEYIYSDPDYNKTLILT